VAINGDDYDRVIRSTMVELTRTFATATDVEDILAGVTAAAVELIDGVDEADVLLISDGQFRTMTPTSPLATQLDAAQQRFNEGPCLQAAIADAVIRCPDLRDDPRWPQFAAAAVDAGVYSMLSYQLYTHHSGAGTLNLFGRNPRTFDVEAQAIGAMLATHAATALIAANKQHQFESALAGRDLIGQAKGIFMERFDVDAVRAFELLSKLSQNTNTPVRVIAQQIIDRNVPVEAVRGFH
jgi:transcriptional regulator with GAF, ATPase, and Fis domain